MMNLFFFHIAPVVSEKQDDHPLVQPVSRKEPAKERVNLLHNAEFLHSYEEEKGPPVWRDPSAALEQDVSGNSREPIRRSVDFGHIQTVKVSAAS